MEENIYWMCIWMWGWDERIKTIKNESELLAVEGTLIVPGELFQPYLSYQFQLLLLVFYFAEGVMMIFVVGRNLWLSRFHFSVE